MGTETKKQRSCVVFQTFPPGQLVTIIPCTTTKSAKRFPYTCEIKASSSDNLPKDSIALIFQIRSLSMTRFGNKQGNVTMTTWKKILGLLKDYLDIAETI